ncbi:MAG: hypothetical protein GY904_19560 [Planctomycetaceae bacterium]|nr:hypothetical protein [Planctomycetaceae bacterium]
MTSKKPTLAHLFKWAAACSVFRVSLTGIGDDSQNASHAIYLRIQRRLHSLKLFWIIVTHAPTTGYWLLATGNNRFSIGGVGFAARANVH